MSDSFKRGMKRTRDHDFLVQKKKFMRLIEGLPRKDAEALRDALKLVAEPKQP